MTVRNFARRLMPICVVVFSKALAYTTMAWVQAPAAPSATPPIRSGIAPLPRVTSPRGENTCTKPADIAPPNAGHERPAVLW